MTAPQPIEIPPPSPDDVLYRKDGDIAWVTLNRPVVPNAINWSIRRRRPSASAFAVVTSHLRSSSPMLSRRFRRANAANDQQRLNL
ncbi:MAG: hypothetical protein ACRDJE_26140 [Dehalococcoidia bacterium]